MLVIPVYGVSVCKEGADKSRNDEHQREGIEFQFEFHTRRDEKGKSLTNNYEAHLTPFHK